MFLKCLACRFSRFVIAFEGLTHLDAESHIYLMMMFHFEVKVTFSVSHQITAEMNESHRCTVNDGEGHLREASVFYMFCSAG